MDGSTGPCWDGAEPPADSTTEGPQTLGRCAVIYERMDSPAWRPTGLVRYGAAAALFGAAIALWLHEVVVHPGSRIAGGFGDATGALHDYWSAQAQHRTPFDFTHDALNGAPEGFERTPAALLANSGAADRVRLVSRGAVGLVGAWNTFLFLGLFATAMAMFALLDRLGCTFVASMFGGSCSRSGRTRSSASRRAISGWSRTGCSSSSWRRCCAGARPRTLALGAAVGAARSGWRSTSPPTRGCSRR